MSATGLQDAWQVVTEPFTQWVVEDYFSLDRPPFESARVELVSDVAPSEMTKHRMLNGSHSTLLNVGAIDVRDPLAPSLKAVGDAARQNPTRLVDGKLRIKEVLGEDLPRSAPFRRHLVKHLISFFELGAAKTERNMLEN